ncbi:MULTISPECIES: ABC transporter substrate-binding protein [unclassified Thermosynechococcus]|uniref:ABC transporter substrate-binding protein n=1 Tax=unclassified Thermosynechococcus TaxID=2622553 RepID=UPI00197CF553|nr:MULTISPECIES: ABC transporter substrate-binding protein [unclassified Thermosynechococcus]QSF49538.1 amino acid ABC transporter substrate-binding protein [Thermosynechococcus sp. TA-1]WNC22618.1 ABC transporter substrate-binding protein [Thermosynechococcus sp. PP22]WNC30319.1 ABC transporter substrate-binding protein [Thermosynechococcus sp. PKX82]WNC32857.1 ABC transporter substrate-binding protein [Thermosynechococcus sp. PKX95]WNC35383.1 ABC transporter substrate-binding protein [Thermo
MGWQRRTFLRHVSQGIAISIIATASKSLLTACGGKADSLSGSTATGIISSNGLLSPGTLTWGADPIEGAPYVFYDPADRRRLIGFEVEIAEAIARLMGVRAFFFEVSYDQLFAALAANRFDMILNGWEITTDRKRIQWFSQPYYRYGQQIVVRADDPRFEKYTATSEVTLANLAGMTVGTGMSYKAQEILEKDPRIKTRLYDDATGFMNALAIGHVDALLVDFPIVAYYVLGAGPGGTVNNSLRPIGVPIFLDNYVIAFNKNNPKGETLKTEVDQAIDILKKDGTLRRIYEKWKIWNDQQTQIGIV